MKKILAVISQLWLIISQLWSIVKKHFPLYKDGYFWFSMTCFFALFVPAIARGAILKYTVRDFFSEGDIVLFSMIIVTSLVIDNFFFEGDFTAILQKEGFPRRSRDFLLFIAPMMAIVLCIIVYIRCQSLKEQLDMFTMGVEIVLFMAVAIYAAFVKQTVWDRKKQP